MNTDIGPQNPDDNPWCRAVRPLADEYVAVYESPDPQRILDIGDATRLNSKSGSVPNILPPARLPINPLADAVTLRTAILPEPPNHCHRPGR
mgnify:CR=1 FL=1